ncbi:MAG: symmetrical bis(5'-nucleosyl)-tetraphosphatase [Halieaceae bacterium]|jgi:bis(5'-nucleosyl)-tetraphosphatase (symmetrical)|nr:symmetrical bis(5'-nucleosyl)-tetraphosphatase [Halieaceae bacterium]
MTTWVVGDVQGCLPELEALLEQAGFDWQRDVLWSTGDIVNRGTDCLGTLRFFFEHRDRVRMVLGNHDLHLLAVASGAREASRSDTLDAILSAPDRDQLLGWLQQQPLLHREGKDVLVHAGIPPQWSVDEAEARAREVEAVLRGPDSASFFRAMYGNEPAKWSDTLTGMERLRVITNYFTRMRYCTRKGRLDLASKGPLNNPGGPAASDPKLKAWFAHEGRAAAGSRILFGHWAALMGSTGIENAIALDTGCVWGNAMTLFELESGQRVVQSCHRP